MLERIKNCFYILFHRDSFGNMFLLFKLSQLCKLNSVREAFNKKKHSFYGIFHNRQTPPGYGEEEKKISTPDFRHLIFVM